MLDVNWLMLPGPAYAADYWDGEIDNALQCKEPGGSTLFVHSPCGLGSLHLSLLDSE